MWLVSVAGGLGVFQPDFDSQVHFLVMNEELCRSFLLENPHDIVKWFVEMDDDKVRVCHRTRGIL